MSREVQNKIIIVGGKAFGDSVIQALKGRSPPSSVLPLGLEHHSLRYREGDVVVSCAITRVTFLGLSKGMSLLKQADVIILDANYTGIGSTLQSEVGRIKNLIAQSNEASRIMVFNGAEFVAFNQPIFLGKKVTVFNSIEQSYALFLQSFRTELAVLQSEKDAKLTRFMPDHMCAPEKATADATKVSTDIDKVEAARAVALQEERKAMAQFRRMEEQPTSGREFVSGIELDFLTPKSSSSSSRQAGSPNLFTVPQVVEQAVDQARQDRDAAVIEARVQAPSLSMNDSDL